MIHVVQEVRCEALFDRLAEDLSLTPPGPARREVVIVESVGMARRLPLELAQRLGAVAGLHTPFPARFLWEELLRPGLADPEEASPWEVKALAWRLAALLPECLEGPGSETARRLLARDPDGRLRHELARRLAALFDQYLVYRPDWLLEWQGHPNAGGEPGAGPPELAAAAWQRLLWRRLDAQTAQPHRAALQADWLERQTLQEGFPHRLSLFALSGLPPAQLALFDTLSRRVPVRVYLLNPSREYWGDLPGRRPRRAMDEAEGRAPLLASCGGELGVWIDGLLEIDAEFHGPTVEPPPPHSALEILQAGLYDLEVRPGIPADDRSLQFHSCHSPRRQVEVLLDCLLDLFAADPSLQPGEVLVLCPDLATLRPHFEAVFSSQDARQRIPWRVLGASGGSGLGSVLDNLLDLVGSRWESGRVLAILRCAALRRRQGLADEDLPRLAEWCHGAGIRWGWDARHRSELGLPALDEHGWRTGMDRLLLGYAKTGGQVLEGVVPLDAAGGEPALLQAWLGWLLLARRFESEAASPRTPGDWARWLLDWMPRFFAPDEEEERELRELRESLLELAASARAGEAREPLAFSAAKDVLRQALAGDEGIRGGGFDGRLVLAPMLACRGLSARVIALLGLEDGVFPRPSRRDELDLSLLKPRRGDRQPRLQDRGLFLDALGGARSSLLLFWTGRDLRENRERPPCTVVSELLDSLGGPSGRVRVHALQPFSPLGFQPDSRPPGRHAGWGRAASRLLHARRRPESLAASLPLLEVPEGAGIPRILQLGELERFFQNPARAFLRRAGLSLPWDGGPPEEEEPFVGDAKALGALRSRLLAWEEQALPEEEQEPRLRAAGLLPWGHPGSAELRRARREVRELRRRALEARGGPPTLRDVEWTCGELQLRARLETPAPLRVECRSGKAAGAALAGPWLRHLLWSACGGEGRTRLFFLDDELELPPVAEAGPLLDAWLRAWLEGQRRWLPWLPLVSESVAAECLRARADGREARLDLELYRQREYLWEDAWLQTVLGGADPFTHAEIAPALQEWALRLAGPLQEALA